MLPDERVEYGFYAARARAPARAARGAGASGGGCSGGQAVSVRNRPMRLLRALRGAMQHEFRLLLPGYVSPSVALPWSETSLPAPGVPSRSAAGLSAARPPRRRAPRPDVSARF